MTHYFDAAGNEVQVRAGTPLPVTGTFTVSEAPSTSASAAIAPVKTNVAASNKVLSAAPANLYGFNAQATVDGWFLVFDATSLPGDGTVTPIKQYKYLANTTLEVGYGIPLRCGTGVTIGFSTTGPFTLTASATAFISGEVA